MLPLSLRAECRTWRAQSRLVLSLPSAQLIAELSLIPWLFSASGAQGSSSHHPGALGASCSDTEIYLLCAGLSLGSSKGQEDDCPLLSASPNPSGVFLFPNTTSQAKLEEASRHKSPFSGNYLLVIFITVFQPSLDFPPPSKAEDCPLGSRVGKLALIHASEFLMLLLLFSVLWGSLQDLNVCSP